MEVIAVIAVTLFCLFIHAICYAAYEDAEKAKAETQRCHDHGC